MKEPCTRILSESKLLGTLVKLLSTSAGWVKENESKISDVATPK